MTSETSAFFDSERIAQVLERKLKLAEKSNARFPTLCLFVLSSRGTKRTAS